MNIKYRIKSSSIWRRISFSSFAAIATHSAYAQTNVRPQTFCNPIDLAYRFVLKDQGPSSREAADPSVVFFENEWWLFASKSGGYWHTKDFSNWIFVEPEGLPLEEYAPTAAVINGMLCFSAGGNNIYTSKEPAKGKWQKLSTMPSAGDVDLFQDDDGKVYVYSGVSDRDPIIGKELDPKNSFKVVGDQVDLISGQPKLHGWENKFTRATGPLDTDIESHAKPPYIEGAWMTKYNGLYFLQYAGPGTEFNSYGDGYYVGNHPLGPFKYHPSNPFSFHPTGFAAGAGHGSTFQDSKGNYWHISTVSIGKRRSFERRLGMFPVKFFPDGQLAGNTYLCDYPQYLPGTMSNVFSNNSPGWMLVSLNKPVSASSTDGNFAPQFAVDPTIQTWWSAATGNAGEWLQVDLREAATIQAIQLNFADEGSLTYDRLRGDAYRYKVEISVDGIAWKMFLDKSQNQKDAPHDYTQLPSPAVGRYIRVTNIHTPAGAKFSVSGLRLFGNTTQPAAARVSGIFAERAVTDGRCARIRWNKSAGAEFYIVRYGISPDRLYSNYEVYNAHDIELSTLNVGTDYYFTVDAINGRSITFGPAPVKLTSTWSPIATTPKPISRTNWTLSSSDASVDNPLRNAIDGDSNTRWSTGKSQSNGQWLQVDLGSSQLVSSIILDATGSSEDYPRKYSVQLSENAKQWTTVVKNGFGVSGITSIKFETQKTRYIRIYQEGSSPLWWSIHELVAYGPSQN